VGILQPVRERRRMDRPVHGSQPTFLPNCRLPVLRDQAVARSMGPRRVHIDRLTR
jgi:hypothetical protein